MPPSAASATAAAPPTAPRRRSIRPLTIAVVYACGRLDSIYPQPHEIPLDAIVTEAGVVRHRYRGRALVPAGRGFEPAEEEGYASPPCSMHELDPAYLGYLSTAETIELLNELLEGERAGARAVGEKIGRAHV